MIDKNKNEKVILKRNEDGELVATSRQVAEDFRKEHNDTKKRIRELIRDMGEISHNYFILSKYKDSLNRSQEEYLLTRDGFSLLVMGFTGTKALEWKLKYIEAFNTMERKLKEISKPDSYMIDDPIERAKRWIEEREQYNKIAAELEEQNSFVNKVSESNGSMLVREVAKLASKGNITIGEKALWNKLREWGYISRKSTEPMQSAINAGWFEVIERVVDRDGKSFVYRTTKVTSKGQIHIIKKLSKESENKLKKIQ